MSLTYTTYVDQIANLMAVAATDPNFTTFLPGCIDYAEQRIYRDLNLINTTVTQNLSISSDVRTAALPTTVTGSTQGFQTITAVSAMLGNIVPLPLVASWQSFIDFVYGSPLSGDYSPNVFNGGGVGSTAVWPRVYAIIGSTSPATPGPATLLFGPPASQSIPMQITGTIRPAALTAGNPTTLLSNMYPDLLVAASMVFVTGFQRDFGAQSDDPRMGASWENQYKTLLQSALTEQGRARYDTHLNKGAAAPEGGE